MLRLDIGIYVIYGNNVMSAQMLEVSLLGVGTVLLRLERGACMYVENDEKSDGMCEKCCDAGRGNLEVC